MIIIIFTILSALYDSGKRFVDHRLRFLFRFLVVFTVSFFSEIFISSFLLNSAIFYFIFDYLLNFLERRDWNYVGNTAKIDILWRKIGGWIPQYIFKLSFLLITIKYYYHGYENLF